jgi:hypothetical protein
MNYNYVINKLKNNPTIEEIRDIADCLLSGNVLCEVKYSSNKLLSEKFLVYLVKDYDGIDEVINNKAQKIFEKNYPLNSTSIEHFCKDITCFEKKKYFLEIVFGTFKKRNMTTQISFATLFQKIDDKKGFVKFMQKYDNIKLYLISNTGNLVNIYDTNSILSIMQYNSTDATREIIRKAIGTDNNTKINFDELKTYIKKTNTKYTNNDIRLLITNGSTLEALNIIILSEETHILSDDFIIDEQLFLFLMRFRCYDYIYKSICNKKIPDIEKCANLFVNDMYLKQIKSIPEDDKISFANIYKYFVDNKYAESCENHLNYFCELYIEELIVYLSYKYKMIPSYDNYQILMSDVPQFAKKLLSSHELKTYHLEMAIELKKFDLVEFLFNAGLKPTGYCFDKFIENTQNNIVVNMHLFDIVFENFEFNENRLIYACNQLRSEIVLKILNLKVIPTYECFRATIGCRITRDKKCVKQTIKINEYNKTINEIVKYLMAFGYKITKEDIELAASNNVLLDIDISIPEYIPDENYYALCDKDNMPKYNDNMYKDALWIYRLCQLVTKATDYKYIQNYVTINDIAMYSYNIDKCSHILQDKQSNKTKENFLAFLAERDRAKNNYATFMVDQAKNKK